MDYNAEGVYTNIFEAFSREDPNHKVYVQNIFEHKKDLFDNLMYKHGGSIYMCGSFGMANSMRDVAWKHIEEINETSEDEAKKEYESMITAKRICVEAWA